jgi:glutamine---fructose-6-phosphate transaminase (isomerizing)
MSEDFREAVLRQPENLRDGAQAFREAIADADLGTLRRGTLVLGGIGASAHALIPTTLELRAAGMRVFAVSTGELREDRARELGDAFVLVSQSGASVETLEALTHVEGAPVVAVTANANSPLARAADVWLPLGPFTDTPVATLSYTATLQALGMLCDALLERTGHERPWDRLPELAAGVLAHSDQLTREIAPGFATTYALDAVGAGNAQAGARETALLGREALRLAATGMETREYLHGPMEAVGPGFGCVVFGRERERRLSAELASFGAAVTLVSDSEGGDIDGVGVIRLPDVDRLAAPILEILPVQLLVDHTAGLRGLSIGELRRHQQDTKAS